MQEKMVFGIYKKKKKKEAEVLLQEDAEMQEGLFWLYIKMDSSRTQTLPCKVLLLISVIFIFVWGSAEEEEKKKLFCLVPG